MSSSSQKGAGRFAPSPTGPLHLGSLIAALGSYLLARNSGRRWLLRIDDLDRPRVVPGAAAEILRLLETLGFTWDEAPVYQSLRNKRYAEVLGQLRESGLIYPCSCSRKEVLASAPHAGEEGPVYPGTCREKPTTSRAQYAQRLKVTSNTISFHDGLQGDYRQNLQTEVGDFVLFRADGLFAYQVATVIDDLDAGIDQVVRGADLLTSTPRQIFLYRCLHESPPEYFHLPLLLDEAGEKISKRQGEAGCVTGENGSSMMCLALIFLGQPPPRELCGAPAVRLLEWAVANFEMAAVPRANLKLSGLQFSY
ncbi:tRNA glutamyl-Q(34) synthetase GluQRS [Geopsychrobacter electrodiphilus]|uniref:tRNA glutamyl-Q(34) synthetase GluQRS n=1 Tax=Geopsychrobacter electrodiphilus TaxID=225196 RepID=UPI00039ED0D9|nr:tRNA glutamyl-Q(34) synthetase GluQRS [Geopsychrobacter electrodiphilus]